MDYNWSDFAALAPIVIFVVGGCALLLSEVFLSSGRRTYQAGLSAAFAAVAGLTAWAQADAPARDLFGGFARLDAFGSYTAVIVAFSLFLTSLLSQAYLRAQASERGEFHALSHFAAAGMVLLAVTTDLLTMFVALEVMSLAVYALVAWIRSSARPAEASLKYFVLGSFSSAIFLYGAALAYGAAGSTRLMDIAAAAQGAPSLLLVAALALLGAGFLFKVAAVPFHTWVPDVYEGAPTPVTGFMAAGVKAAAFAAFLRVFFVAFGDDGYALGEGASRGWYEAVKWLAIITMIIGNLLAIAQSSVKRMLAYSSISHAGYLLVGVTIGAQSGSLRELATSSTLFYLAAYAATVIGAFAVVSALEKRGGRDADDDGRYDGLSQRHPALALAMALFMLSLAGIPPTAGFAAKLFIFRAALEANEIALVLVGLVSSIAGLYYYLRVVVVMYMRPDRAGAPVASHSGLFAAGLAVAAIATLLIGILPAWLGDFARSAAALGAATP